ncbi:MAG: ABC transporter substrate-binding protein [Planctomycetes bacterium]|nr:ABC transporter substrate-binding protein [Planctomycetota bacterium]
MEDRSERPGLARPRVVSLLPAATQILARIGAARDLVAVSHTCVRPDTRELPRVLSTTIDSDAWSMARIDAEVRAAVRAGTALYALDEERIRALRPTHVISQGLCPVCAVTPGEIEPVIARATALGPSTPRAELESRDGDSAARARCAELVVLTPHSLADIARDVRTVGDAVGRSASAERVARDFDRRLDALRALPPIEPRPRVAVLEWFDPLWASGEWIAELVEVAGGEPVLARADEASKRVEWADLVAADPDVIVLAACSMSVARAERELGALVARPEWNGLRAVRAGRVVLMDGERWFSTPGPDVARGAEALARLLRAPNADGGSEWKRLEDVGGSTG